MTATVQGGNDQTIAYSSTSMTKNITINIEWEGTDSDTSTKDGTDLAAKGSTLSLPVTLTAKQSVVGH